MDVVIIEPIDDQGDVVEDWMFDPEVESMLADIDGLLKGASW